MHRKKCLTTKYLTMKQILLTVAASMVVSGTMVAQPLLEKVTVGDGVQAVQTLTNKADFLKADFSKVVRADFKAVNAGKVEFGLSRAGGVEAYYYEPEGIFTSGLSSNYLQLNGAQRRGSGGFNYVFTNQSQNAESYTWQYPDFLNSGETGTSHQQDLSFYVPWSSFDAVKLTAEGEGSSSTYTAPQNRTLSANGNSYPAISYAAGGPADQVVSDGTVLGITTYSQMYEDWGVGAAKPFSYPMSGANEDGTWTDALKNVGTPREMTGFATLFPQPNGAYTVSKLWFHSEWQASAPFQLMCTLYEMTQMSDGTYAVGDPFAMGTADYPAAPADYMPEFELYAVDSDGMVDEDAEIIIDTPVMAVISGLEDSGCSLFYPVYGDGYRWTEIPNNPGYVEPVVTDPIANQYSAFCVVSVNPNDGGDPYDVYCNTMNVAPFWINQANQIFGVQSFLFMMDASFYWCREVNNATTLNFPKDGGNAYLTFQSFYNMSDADNVAYEFVSDSGSDWIEITELNVESNRNQILTFEASALTNGEDRTGELTIRAKGCKPINIKVSQGTNAIDGVEADKDVKTVEYYDVMGRKLNAQPENGMFIRKAVMIDGSVRTAKVAK